METQLLASLALARFGVEVECTATTISVVVRLRTDRSAMWEAPQIYCAEIGDDPVLALGRASAAAVETYTKSRSAPQLTELGAIVEATGIARAKLESRTR